MIVYCNCDWLVPEITDVIKLFDAEDEPFGYHFEYSGGNYYNHIEYNGEFYDCEDFEPTADETEFKRYAKRVAKLAFYKLLSKVKGVEMPYGALTGVRPTKLAYMERAAGRDFKRTFADMGVSAANIEHVASVLQTQKEIYENAGGQNLFVSIPFCPTKCEYCSFITAPISATKNLVDPYISCVERELQAVKPLLSRVKSVYIGGGTPFAVSDGQLERVLQAIAKLNLPQVEYTVEAGRPDTFTEEKLSLCKRYGVNRICVNPQTLKDETLVKIGRKHTAEQFLQAYREAAEYGFSINVDLIAGLTGESAADFERSLKAVIELNPDNITVHTLSLKSGAKLKENCNRLHVENIGEMIALSRKLLTQADYSPYYMYRQKYQAGGHENCGWCKRGKASVYNVDVMEEIADNVAVGANAISKRVVGGGASIERYASPKDIKTYIDKVEEIILKRNGLFAD